MFNKFFVKRAPGKVQNPYNRASYNSLANFSPRQYIGPKSSYKSKQEMNKDITTQASHNHITSLKTLRVSQSLVSAGLLTGNAESNAVTDLCDD